MDKFFSGFKVASNLNPNALFDDFKNKAVFENLPKKLQNKHKEDNAALVLMTFSFTVSEFIHKFNEFVKIYNRKQDFKFNLSKFTKIALKYSKEQYLGVRLFYELFEHLELKSSDAFGLIFGKNDSQSDMIDPKIIKLIYDNLCEDGFDFASFSHIIHILLIFFLSDCIFNISHLIKLFKTICVDSNSSLLNSLIRQGMNRSDLKMKCITYKMVEKAVIDHRLQNLISNALIATGKSENSSSFGYKQVEDILKKIRAKMKVNYISNIEEEKLSFESNDPNTFGFGKWMALNILQQTMWSQLKQNNQYHANKDCLINNTNAKAEKEYHNEVLDYVTQEIYCKIAAVVDEFSEDIFNRKVLGFISDIQEHSGKRITVNDYVECLHKATQYYCDSVTVERIRSSVLMLFFDLANCSDVDELSDMVGSNCKDTLVDMDIEAALGLQVLDFVRMSEYSYFVLRRESERFMQQVILQMLIPDFHLISKDFDKINNKLISIKSNIYNFAIILLLYLLLS